MDDKHLKLLSSLNECEMIMKEIKFICERAKRHYIEEKDIDDILALLKEKV